MPQELPDGWRDQLPEDIKTNGVLDDISSIDQMATMIVNSRTAQAHSIRIPGEDVTDDKRMEFLTDLQTKVPDLVYVGEGADLSNVYDRMGRPKEAAEYALGDIPEPLQNNFAHITEKAHELGLSDTQLKGLTETILTDFNASMDGQAGQIEAGKKQLENEYGAAMEDKLNNAADFASMLGFDANFSAAIKDGMMGLDNMKAFDKVMDGYESVGPRIGGEAGGGSTRLTPFEAEAKLTEMQNNKEHPLNNPSDPMHKEAQQKFVDLVKQADAGKAQTETDKFRIALNGG